MSGLTFTLNVNGVDRAVDDVWVGESLLSVLRDRIGLYGTKGACEQGECGSCSVLVDGELVCACLVLAASVAGKPVITIEGLAPSVDGVATDVQRAFVEQGAVQCGFCTPGLVVAVHHLLDHNPTPSALELREALSGNVCRCTGYGRIFAAVESVVTLRRGGSGGAG
jgi:carbon-monoxide dehydrogenase small subunit